MKTHWLFVVSELLLVLTIVCLFSGWKGSVGFNFGWPLSQFRINISGGAQGGWVLLGCLCLLASLVTFVAALARAMKAPRALRAA